MSIERTILFIQENLRIITGMLVVLFFAILLLVIIVSKNTQSTKTKVIINNKTFNVYVAKSEIEKQIGLSSKNKISPNQGMLFLFDKPDYYSFWMKEMKFSIDIIYIENNKVITVISDVKPPTDSKSLLIYKPKKKSDMVIEINAGLAKKYNIREGTSINIESL